jgi:S1-C subfamily serine protease
MNRRRLGCGLGALLLAFFVAAPGYGWAASPAGPRAQEGPGQAKANANAADKDRSGCRGMMGTGGHELMLARVGREFDSGAGWLGIAVSEVTAEKAKEANLPRAEGVLVERVLDASPGAKAGLKSGDIITRYNGQEVEGLLQFMRLVRETPPGRTAGITIRREGKEEKLSAEVGARQNALRMPMQMPMGMPMHRFEPEEMERNFRFHMPWMGGWQKPLLGIEAESIHGQLGEYFQVPGGEGVLVEEVEAGSAAEKAGLKAGDVITAAAGKPVHEVGELRKDLQAGCGSKPVRLDVVRKGKAISLDAQIACPAPPRSPKQPAL